MKKILSLLLSVIFFLGLASPTFALVTTTQIANKAVTTSKIANNSIGSMKIKDGNVTTAKIANNSIGSMKIKDGNVTTAKIANNSTGSMKIKDGNVTDSKVVNAITIDGGTIENTPIGATYPDTGNFTDVNVSGVFNLGFDTLTIADTGNAASASATLEINSSYTQVQCNDSDGCNVTFGETNAEDGDFLIVENISTPSAFFVDTSGVSELAGAFTSGIYDTLSVLYGFDRWVELSRSNN